MSVQVITYANMHALWGVGLLCAGAACVLVIRSCKRYRMVRIIRGSTFHSMLTGYSLSRMVVKATLFFVSMIALSYALLRPQADQDQEVVQQQGRDLLIAVDVSRSMLAQDCSPNRLAVTKQKIRTLINQLSSDRIGLILFSSAAYVQCPLTTDHAAFLMFLDALDVETVSSGSTAIDGAIHKALEVFALTPDRKNKLLVLFTDGEDFSTNLQGIKDAAKHAHMNIFAMGVGSPQGAPIPLFDEHGKQFGHQKDKKGSVVISRLHEDLLQDIARETGGHYARVYCDDDRDVTDLAQRVLRYERELFGDKKLPNKQELYHWPLLVGFLCLALEWIL